MASPRSKSRLVLVAGIRCTLRCTPRVAIGHRCAAEVAIRDPLRRPNVPGRYSQPLDDKSGWNLRRRAVPCAAPPAALCAPPTGLPHTNSHVPRRPSVADSRRGIPICRNPRSPIAGRTSAVDPHSSDVNPAAWCCVATVRCCSLRPASAMALPPQAREVACLALAPKPVVGARRLKWKRDDLGASRAARSPTAWPVRRSPARTRGHPAGLRRLALAQCTRTLVVRTHRQSCKRCSLQRHESGQEGGRRPETQPYIQGVRH